MTRLSTLAFAALVAPASGWEEICQPFDKIYADGTELCEKMWNNAFKVVPDTENGYTMWFFDADNNPNDEITRILHGDDALPIDQCHLQYFHKDEPSPESDDMRECHPWKNNACCHSDTVTSVDKLRASYGEGFEWDRCGPMSDACKRFFVYEACFYECSPNAGLYRKFKDEDKDHPDFNEWQIEQMPIQQGFCDSWYEACRNDYFCGKGDFWECDAHYWANQKIEEGKSNDKDALTIALSVVGVIAAFAVLALCVMVHKEKKGNPVFKGEANHQVS